MANKLVSVRLSKNLEQESLGLVDEKGFSSLQELIRTSLIDKISEWKREKALLEIGKLKGSQKGIIASKEELAQLAKEKYY